MVWRGTLIGDIMKKDFTKKVYDICREDAELCIACGRCSAVCPFSDLMDVKPHQIIHMVRIGDESVVDTNAIWYCVSCLACTQRCPREINITAIIEALRLINLRKRKDAIELRGVRELEALPTIALVGAGRKYTG